MANGHARIVRRRDWTNIRQVGEVLVGAIPQDCIMMLVGESACGGVGLTQFVVVGWASS